MSKLGYLFFIPALSWFYLTIVGKSHGFFGGIAWWKNVRLIHAVIFFLFAILSIYKWKKAYWFLYLDVIIGLLTRLFTF